MLALAVFVRLMTIYVTGGSDCPTPAQVKQAYAAVAPATSAERDDNVQIDFVGDEVVMRATSAQGALVGEKRLRREDACEDLASAFAVSLATWQNDVAFAYSPSVAERAPAALVSQPPKRPWDVGLGVGVLGTAKLDSPAVRVLVLGRWQATATGALRVSLATGSEQTLSLGPGQARWIRSSIGLGWQQKVVDAPSLSLFGTALLAWLQVRGEGFMSNRSDGVIDAGVELGAHGSLYQLAFLRVWMEMGAAAWPRAHNVLTPAESPVKALPAAELFVRLGLSTGGR